MLRTVKNIILNIFPNISRKILYLFNGWLYRGENNYCPLCEKSYKQFLSGPENRSKNVKCPGCGSLERQRLLWLYLNNRIKIKDKKIRLLNIAPDYAIQNKLKKLPNIKYLSVDLSSRLAMQREDLTKLTFDDNYFDAVLCYHVLEHIADDQKAISEIYRVMKPGGWAILQTPYEQNLEKTFEDFSIKSAQDRKKFFGQEDHVRIYGRDYIERIKNAGFEVQEDRFIDTVDKMEKQRLALDENETIIFCIKPKQT